MSCVGEISRVIDGVLILLNEELMISVVEKKVDFGLTLVLGGWKVRVC